MKRRRMTERERRLVTAVKYAAKSLDETAEWAAAAGEQIDGDSRNEHELRQWAADQTHKYQHVARNYAHWLRTALEEYTPKKRGGK